MYDVAVNDKNRALDTSSEYIHCTVYILYCLYTYTVCAKELGLLLYCSLYKTVELSVWDCVVGIDYCKVLMILLNVRKTFDRAVTFMQQTKNYFTPWVHVKFDLRYYVAMQIE